MFDRVLNTPLNDISRLDRCKIDRSSKYVLLWKSSVFIVLSIIRNQSKTKAVPHTAFETFINNKQILNTKLKRFHGGFSELEMIDTHKSFFIKNHN